MAFEGKVALIAGGVKNLGAQPVRSAKIEAELQQSVKVVAYQGDLASAAAVTKLLGDVKRDFGKIDIVVNTVGKVLKKPITEITEEEYDTLFAAAKHVSDDGKIITIVTALLGAFTGYYTSYAGSKAPVEHFTRGVCKELQSRRVSVNNIAPWPMDTPFFYPQESPEAVEFHKANGMGGRLNLVQDIAPIVRFLCTEGIWITGQTIFANGGYTTR
ncbi:hypothetical protein BDW75DRAFT_249306 [Aspergillus navahoensis]